MAAKLLLALALLLPLLGRGQERIRSVRIADEPRTKLETFAAKTGAVIVTISSNVGSLSAAAETLASVETRAMRDTTSNEKHEGIAIRIVEPGGSAGETQALIDSDEIEALLKGLDYISAVEKGVTKLANFRADFRTNGNFEVSAYTAPDNQVGISLSTGRVGGISGTPGASVYLDFAELAKLRRLIATAQSALKTLPQP